MNHRDERLGSAPLGKLMFSLAVPSVAAQLINVLYNIETEFTSVIFRDMEMWH